MSTELASAYLSLIPSLKGAQGAVAAELGGLGGAGGVGGKALGGGILGGLKGALGPVAGVMAGVFATGAIIGWGKEQIASLARIETINAQTASAIKATGGAAQVSSKHIEDLAGSLENTTATEAESIQQGANLLLTFKNIKNGAGQGNDIFDQTTRIMTDMSRAMGTDAKGGAVQLGKALNDPVKGISALSRVGVTFTDEQKKMIQSLVDTGDTMGAQKIILNELNSEFGGAGAAYAQTYAGKVDLLGHAWGTFGETLLQNVTPGLGVIASAMTGLLNNVLTPFAGFVSTGLTAAFGATKGAISNFFSGLINGTDELGSVQGTFASFGAQTRLIFENIKAAIGPVFAGLAPVFGQLWSAIAPLAGQFLQLYTQISPLSLIMQALTPILPQLIGVFTQLATTLGGTLSTVFVALMPVITQLATVLGGVLTQAATTIVPIIGQLASTLGGVFGSLLTALVPIIGQLAMSLGGALASALTAILPALMSLMPIISQLLGAFGQIVSTVLSALLPILPVLAGLFVTILSAVLPLVPVILQLVSAFIPLLTPIIDLIGALLPPLIGLLVGLLGPILGLVGPLVSALAPAIQVVVQVLAAVVGAVATALTWFINLITGSGNARAQIAAIWNAIPAIFTAVIGKIGGAISAGISTIVGFVSGLNTKVANALSGAGTWLLNAGKQIITGLINGIKGAAGAVADAAKGVAKGAIDAAKNLLGIHSPSRVFREIGQFIGAGLKQGIAGSKSGVQKAMKDLSNAAVKAFKGKEISENAKRAIGRATVSITTSLSKLADRQAKLLDRIKSARDKVLDLRADKRDYAADIRDSVTSAVGAADQTTAGGFVANLQNQIAKTKQFTKVLASLKKQGLDKATYDELAQGGVDSLGIASSILSSGKTGIKQIAALKKQLGTTASKLGADTSATMYSAGISAANGLLKGLQSREAALKKQMSKLAASLVRSIKQALGIHSPSRVLRDQVGVQIGAGVESGIRAQITAVEAAMSDLVRVPSVDSFAPRLTVPLAATSAAAASGAGTGGRSTSLTVNNYGTRFTEQQLLTAQHKLDVMI